ncbi:MAG: hypothetical protein ACREJP_08625 [Candidatus Methylomirabilales bacterium]
MRGGREIRLGAAGVLLVAALLLGAWEGAAAWAQQPACAPGRLCLEETPGERLGGGGRRTVQDPPGNYARSLTTISVIVVFVGGYLYLALSGKSLSFLTHTRAPRRSD